MVSRLGAKDPSTLSCGAIDDCAAIGSTTSGSSVRRFRNTPTLNSRDEQVQLMRHRHCVYRVYEEVPFGARRADIQCFLERLLEQLRPKGEGRGKIRATRPV